MTKTARANPKDIWDVFVSYRTQERGFVRRHLLPALARRGLLAYIDYRDDSIGVTAAAAIARAQSRSRWTLAVLSRTYDQSAFTDGEFARATGRKRLVAIAPGPQVPFAGIAGGDVIDFSSTVSRRKHANALWSKLEREGATRSNPVPQATAQRTEHGRLATAKLELSRALRADDVRYAIGLFRTHLFEQLHYQFASYEENIQLLQMLRTALRRSTDAGRVDHGPTARALSGSMITFRATTEREPLRAWIETALGVSYRVMWNRSKAETCFRSAQRIYSKHSIASGVRHSAVNLADCKWDGAQVDDACDILHAVVASSPVAESDPLYVIAHQDLGLRLAYGAHWAQSAKHLDLALQLADGDRQRGATIAAHRARRCLLLTRWYAAFGKASRKEYTAAAEAAYQAATLARDGTACVSRSRNHVRALWLCGAANLALGRHVHGERELAVADHASRASGLAELRADILIDRARSALARGDAIKAGTLAFDARDAALRLDRKIQYIDASLVLARVFRAKGLREASARPLREVARLLTRRARDSYAIAAAELGAAERS